MARTQTIVQLTDELIELLDDEAHRRGVSRSALIREVLTDHLANAHERSLSARVVAGYLRVPPHTPDAWGKVGQAVEIAEGELLRRLDEEESASGAEGW